jgi:hypothetical protein
MREIELTLFNDAANTIQQRDDGRTLPLTPTIIYQGAKTLISKNA